MIYINLFYIYLKLFLFCVCFYLHTIYYTFELAFYLLSNIISKYFYKALINVSVFIWVILVVQLIYFSSKASFKKLNC